MTFKCSFCGQKFSRNHRAFLSNTFCRKCLNDRILASNGRKISGTPKLISLKNGYAKISFGE